MLWDFSVEGHRLKADISQQDQLDSDYDFDSYESENKPKHESRSEKDVGVTKKQQGKRKLKVINLHTGVMLKCSHFIGLIFNNFFPVPGPLHHHMFMVFFVFSGLRWYHI
jgi:hypothetical protein